MNTNNNLLGGESLAQKMERLKQEMGTEKRDNGKQEISKLKSKHQAEKHQKEDKAAPKLFISGRLDRKKHTYVAKSLSLLANLEEEIKTYCRGGDLAILNYLIKEGLKNVKMSKTSINVEIETIENNIS